MAGAPQNTEIKSDGAIRQHVPPVIMHFCLHAPSPQQQREHKANASSCCGWPGVEGKMKNRAAAAASTFMALISTAESFISTPASASTGGGTNRVTSSAAPCAVGRARAPAGCTPAPLEGCCRVGGIRRRRGTGALRLQAKGGRAPGAGAATQQKRQQQATESTRSSAEGAIDGKRQGEVEQLKKKLQRERAFNQTAF